MSAGEHLTPGQPRGVEAHFTDDGWRDAYALITACLHNSLEGQDAVLDNANLLSLAASLAKLAEAAATCLAGQWSGENWDKLGQDQRADLVKMILVGGLRGAGVPAPPMPASAAGFDSGPGGDTTG